MADFYVIYNTTTLHVFGVWDYVEEVNDWASEEYLELDGSTIITGMTSLSGDEAGVVLSDPTDVSTVDPPGVFEVDQHPNPTDMAERTDDPPGGSKTKDQIYVAP